MMCAYQQYNGTFPCESEELLLDHLKSELNFHGALLAAPGCGRPSPFADRTLHFQVLTDWGAGNLHIAISTLRRSQS